MSNRNVLVVGGGIAGMSFAIRMRKLGWEVDLVELDPLWQVYDTGMMVTGPTYRAFKRLDVLDEVCSKGFASHQGLKVCTASGAVIVEQPSQPLEPDLPTHGGLMRPILHQILSSRTRASGTSIRLGVTLLRTWDSNDQVRAELTDGTIEEYALVVAADGAFSAARKLFFPAAPEPRYTGQYCWRLVAERPMDIQQCHIYVAGPVIAGLMPTSETQIYMFLLQSETQKVGIDESTQWQRLRDIMSPFSGLVGRLRDGLNAQSAINCRPLEAMLLARPWHRDRVIIIGDAAHATTPHLASGAGLAVEDALVLSDEIDRQPDIDSALRRFEDRRWERCRLVAENSIQIGEMQQTQTDPESLAALMAASEAALRQDI
jgi:2-polyprenyl-6-methoxyphenol hydroxylase-like FAD-dependent oxidoreductase